MSKYLKSFATALLVIAATVCLGLFAVACNDKETDLPYPDEVKITVTLPDGTPAAGVSVGICLVQNDVLGACLSQVKTDAQGVATFAVKPYEEMTNVYEVHIDFAASEAGYDEYDYVDENGNSYGEAGVRINVNKAHGLTVKLAKKKLNPITVGVTNITLDSVNDNLLLTCDIQNAGWYKLTSYNAFHLKGNGFNLADDCYDVSLYLNPDDKLTLSVNSDSALTFPLGLTKHDADGTSAHPLPATSGSYTVLKLNANQKVYVTNEAYSPMNGPVALDVSGTNFKASYAGRDYTDKFTLAAYEDILDDPSNPQESTVTRIPQTFSVGTANDAEGVVVLNFVEYVQEAEVGTEENPYVVALDETVTQNISGFGAYYISFTATEDADYKVTVSEGALAEDPTYIHEDLTNFHLAAGETIVFWLGNLDFDTSGERSATVSKK